jgi:nucleoside-diphosphate-sugar epimerase
MRVAILGCGYVGLALGVRLESATTVYGVRRSGSGLEAIEAAGLTPMEGDVTEPESLAAVPDVDALVFAASAGGRDVDAVRDTYVAGQRGAIEAFAERDDPPERYIYTSSTGVYGDHGGDWVDESTPVTPETAREEALHTAESVALEEAARAGMTPTVARLAGLYGPDRYRLSRYVEGPVTEGILNLCHRVDAARALAHLLRTGRAGGELVTVVDDQPMDKWVLADWLAAACGEPAPPKRTVTEAIEAGDLSEAAARRRRASKRCSNDKLRTLGFEPAYPTAHAGYLPATEAARRRADGPLGEP